MVAVSQDILDQLLAYGASPDVLDEYDLYPTSAAYVGGVLRLETETGVRALKKVYMSDQRLEYVFQATEHIAMGGMPRAPRFIRTRFGDPYVLHTTGLYYMTLWRTGETPNLESPRDVVASAELLARWHEAAAAFRPSDGWHPDQIGTQSRLKLNLAELQKLQKRAQEATQATAFDELFLRSVDGLKRRTSLALEALEKAGIQAAEAEARERSLICHGRYTKQNILLDGEVSTVLNYDAVHQGLPIQDLISFFHRYLPKYNWDPALLQAALGAYRNVWGESMADNQLTAALLAAPVQAVQTISWYYRKAKDWDEQAYVSHLNDVLAMEELREKARLELMKAPAVLLVPEFEEESVASLGGVVKPLEEAGEAASVTPSHAILKSDKERINSGASVQLIRSSAVADAPNAPSESAHDVSNEISTEVVIENDENFPVAEPARKNLRARSRRKAVRQTTRGVALKTAEGKLYVRNGLARVEQSPKSAHQPRHSTVRSQPQVPGLRVFGDVKGPRTPSPGPDSSV